MVRVKNVPRRFSPGPWNLSNPWRKSLWRNKYTPATRIVEGHKCASRRALMIMLQTDLSSVKKRLFD